MEHIVNKIAIYLFLLRGGRTGDLDLGDRDLCEYEYEYDVSLTTSKPQSGHRQSKQHKKG